MLFYFFCEGVGGQRYTEGGVLADSYLEPSTNYDTESEHSQEATQALAKDALAREIKFGYFKNMSREDPCVIVSHQQTHAGAFPSQRPSTFLPFVVVGHQKRFFIFKEYIKWKDTTRTTSSVSSSQHFLGSHSCSPIATSSPQLTSMFMSHSHVIMFLHCADDVIAIAVRSTQATSTSSSAPASFLVMLFSKTFQQKFFCSDRQSSK